MTSHFFSFVAVFVEGSWFSSAGFMSPVFKEILEMT
jgi:hypothetical protein